MNVNNEFATCRKLLTSDEDSEEEEKEHKEQEEEQEDEPTKEGEERASKLTKKKKKPDDNKKGNCERKALPCSLEMTSAVIHGATRGTERKGVAIASFQYNTVWHFFAREVFLLSHITKNSY